MLNKTLTIEKKTILRPPVVVVMGHVDHGKTTLLDYIRKSDVASGESGGITQHIGAYEIEHEGRRVTFLDTPGHEAFSKMRSRGARVADVAVLVVAADDGVKPQTLEALHAIGEANTPFVIALNKIDKAGANPDKVKSELAEQGVLVEGWGGTIPVAPISARTGEGITELLGLILLLADMAELTGDPALPASGVVIESHLDPRRGATASLLIKNGTLHKGDFMVSGSAIASVKTLENDSGELVDEATFSSPVIVFGFSSVPAVGDEFRVVSDKRSAEEAVASARAKQPGENGQRFDRALTAGGNAEAAVLPIVVKADVAGSLEAIESECAKLQYEEVALKFIKSGVGDVTDDDVRSLASQKGGVILGFKVKASASATALAERSGTIVKTFDIVYELTDWLKSEVASRVPAEVHKEVIGKLTVLKVFKRVQDRLVFGGMVTTGLIRAGAKFEVVRGGQVTGSGKIANLQRNKADTDEVREGAECGIAADVRGEIAEGDLIQVYTEEVKKLELTKRV